MRTETEIRVCGRLLALLAAIISTAACASWPAKRSPQLAKPLAFPDVPEPATIRLIVDDRSDEPRPERIAKALNRARQKFSYLASASEEIVDPDYTIELSVEHTFKESGLNPLSYYSFLLFPALFSEEVAVEAMVAASGDRALGAYGSTGRRKVVVQMHLLWVFPVAAPLVPHVESKMWNNTFRDVFIQAGEVIAADQRRSAALLPARCDLR